MCFGGGGDNGAAAAAQQQTDMMEAQNAKHDAAVTQGKSSIDQAFQQFDDPYYQKFAQTYKDTYNPQLNDQYALAKDKLTAILAGRDTLDSSIGADAISRQAKTYNDTQAAIGNKASDAANGLRSTVDNTKGQLYAENNNVADPLTMASQAQAQAGSIVSPQSYPTLSNVFADGLAGFSTANKANAQSMDPWAWNKGGGSTAPSGDGTAVFGR